MLDDYNYMTDVVCPAMGDLQESQIVDKVLQLRMEIKSVRPGTKRFWDILTEAGEIEDFVNEYYIEDEFTRRLLRRQFSFFDGLLNKFRFTNVGVECL